MCFIGRRNNNNHNIVFFFHPRRLPQTVVLRSHDATLRTEEVGNLGMVVVRVKRGGRLNGKHGGFTSLSLPPCDPPWFRMETCLRNGELNRFASNYPQISQHGLTRGNQEFKKKRPPIYRLLPGPLLQLSSQPGAPLLHGHPSFSICCGSNGGREGAFLVQNAGLTGIYHKA